jgi:hypothetical protein
MFPMLPIRNPPRSRIKYNLEQWLQWRWDHTPHKRLIK